MAARYEVEAIVCSAKDLKNVNWRHGNLKPYAVVWVELQTKCSTFADDVAGPTYCHWHQKLLIPFATPIEESTLHVDIMHAEAADDTKPLIGSAQLALRDVVLGIEWQGRALQLKRPCGRPQGIVWVDVSVRKLGGGKRARLETGSGVGADSQKFDGTAVKPWMMKY